MNDNIPAWLSPKEFAMETGYSDKTVRKFLQNGTLPGCKPGNQKRSQWRIPKAALDDWNCKCQENLRRKKEAR